MAITVVQTATGATKTNGQTVAYGSNVTSGNLLVVAMLHSYLGCPPSISDTLGSTFTKRVNATQPSGASYYFHLWTAPIPTGGANTVTLSMACGIAGLTVLYELSGHDTTTPYGGANNSTNTANPVKSGSITPTVNGSLVGALFHNTSGDTFTPMTSFTSRYNTAGLFAEDWPQTTAAAINPEATAGGSPSTASGWSFFINAAASGGSVAFRPYYITG